MTSDYRFNPADYGAAETFLFDPTCEALDHALAEEETAWKAALLAVKDAKHDQTAHVRLRRAEERIAELETKLAYLLATREWAAILRPVLLHEEYDERSLQALEACVGSGEAMGLEAAQLDVGLLARIRPELLYLWLHIPCAPPSLCFQPSLTHTQRAQAHPGRPVDACAPARRVCRGARRVAPGSRGLPARSGSCGGRREPAVHDRHAL